MSVVVSVVIPVLNGAKTLGDCLQAVVGQNLDRSCYEVIVVDGGSTDSSSKIAESHDVRLIAQSNRGRGDSRNIGIRNAEGTWVAFTDADCIPSRGWLAHLLATAELDEDVFGAAGPTIGFASTTPAARFADLIGSLDAERYLAHPEYPWAPTANVMYRKQALCSVGGFDARYVSYEACDLHTRLRRTVGGVFAFEPTALVYHRHRERWSDYWRQQFSYGRGYAQFLLRYKSEIPWSVSKEVADWSRVAGLGANALGGGADRLLRRGLFVKNLAQRAGFLTTFWSPRERQRW